MSYTHKIAIIGAGFSGTMVAVQLLRQTRQPLTVYLIEPSLRQVGRGRAYSTDQDCHLLNVPAHNMSALPDEPAHFFTWAKARESGLLENRWVTEVTPNAFLPRRVYGDYLVDLLDKTEQQAANHCRLEKITANVIGITLEPGHIALKLDTGGLLSAQKAVLAIGNFPPSDSWVNGTDFTASGRYFSNPWQTDALAALLETRSCLLVGSGLTMVDWAIALSEAGYQGQIHSVSRHGLMPQVHRPCQKRLTPLTFAAPTSVRRCLRQIRRLIQASDHDWRAVLDALRPVSQSLWEALPLSEQRRFLRHLRTYWDCHRHRLAPVVGSRLDDLLNTGQLRQHSGRVLACHDNGQGVEVVFRARGQTKTQTLVVGAVANCTGSESNYRKLTNPLVQDLLNQHLIRPDPLMLGLDVAADGALIDAGGKVSKQLFTLGPPQKGRLWETTAVPELRGQAEKLARLLLAAGEA
ncbi:FAD/NAD(P)-binding protein [Methylovulum psychrotolerans]|uniref:FAD/NAD(P)-binding protein n=1 Tax=Methylovulum psychrotolerans TaxID=1704499 RepID=UPI0032EB5AA0